jgi:hypothetical protein
MKTVLSVQPLGLVLCNGLWNYLMHPNCDLAHWDEYCSLLLCGLSATERKEDVCSFSTFRVLLAARSLRPSL